MFVNVPLGLWSCVAAFALLRENGPPGPRRGLDLAGSVLVTGGLMLLVYALVRASESAGAPGPPGGCSAVAALSAGAFRGRGAAHPRAAHAPRHLPHARHRRRQRRATLLSAALVAMNLILTLYFQQVLDYPPLHTGLAFLPHGIAAAFAGPWGGRLANRIGPRNVLLLGTAMVLVCMGLLALISTRDTYWFHVLPVTVLMSFGLMPAFVTITILATSGAKPEDHGLVSGILNTTGQLGGALGLAVLVAVAAQARPRPRPPAWRDRSPGGGLPPGPVHRGRLRGLGPGAWRGRPPGRARRPAGPDFPPDPEMPRAPRDPNRIPPACRPHPGPETRAARPGGRHGDVPWPPSTTAPTPSTWAIPGFNARGRTVDHSWEALEEMVAFCHRHEVKVFLALNVLIFETELRHLLETLPRALALGVDAFIVQDLGLARLLRYLSPTQALHASTQMTVTNHEAIALTADLDLARYVLGPRGFPQRDGDHPRQYGQGTGGVRARGPVRGLFGQCLTSEGFGGRSANRGQCAQSCRMEYDLLVDGERRDLGDRRYLVSPKDLCGLDDIPRLMELGIDSFKIEGRLKTPQYVASTASAYRKAMARRHPARSAGPRRPADRLFPRLLQRLAGRGRSPAPGGRPLRLPPGPGHRAR